MNKPEIIKLTKITDERGNLTFLQNGIGLPFALKRLFWTYDLKTHEIRGGHAYRKQNELICVVSGSADIIITYKDEQREVFSLNQADKALFVPANFWRHIENFATNTVLLHFSDSSYNEGDYIRNMNKYLSNE
ncbi:FdtA/QdtA family cupin domain-containing protein [Mesonia ostreae]|uniref:FdtA/QdtA family cupin domain-containing protein n=1 Tax=Mesonia ostreae TaxID=861110 RepID=A0ABU2KM50_9FLAO|nr:FdtA/QdtA family cupin domain-containing protein [Mesonia ostreae]MDT0295754.1 FdtA/QdtA family cupin domain-containing protein [Mesonia ostreae]